MPALTLGTIISYSIETRPRRQHPAIQVDAGRRVTVLLPLHFPEDQIEPLLKKKARWILNHVTAPQLRPAMSSKQFVSGEGILFHGHLLRVKVSVTDAARPEIIYQGRTLRVAIPKMAAPQQPIAVREVLIQWFYAQAVELLPQRSTAMPTSSVLDQNA